MSTDILRRQHKGSFRAIQDLTKDKVISKNEF